VATVREIIDYAKLVYPRVSDISDADIITLINQLIDEVYNKLLRATWAFSKESILSISGQASYQLPTLCSPDNIISVMVSDDVDGIKWTEYNFVGILDDVSVESDNVYMLDGDKILLFSSGEPIGIDSLIINISYYKTPSSVSSINDIPSIEVKYHNLLKYGLIQLSACCGDNPETAIADYWQRKFDEELNTAKSNLSDKFDSAPLKTMELEGYW
jgi:hypothetical protein